MDVDEFTVDLPPATIEERASEYLEYLSVLSKANFQLVDVELPPLLGPTDHQGTLT